MKRKVILDVDTGIDDAIAIILAALHPSLDLVACTTVNGNAEVQYCTDNTLRVLNHIKRNHITVYEGLSRPLVRKDFPLPRQPEGPLERIHGKTLPLAASSRQKSDIGAIDFLINFYRNATENVALCLLAPLTNMAAAVAIYPKLVDLVPEIVIMGGGHRISNTTPSAEFNMWADPEAAHVIFNAGFRKITLVTLDATHSALVSLKDASNIRSLGTPAANAAALLINQRIESGADHVPSGMTPMHDAIAVGSLIEPSLITTQPHHVGIEKIGELTIGRTVIDTRFQGLSSPNCLVAFHANQVLFMKLLMTACAVRD
jgi:inosine-uridine nucleoside N-ribohydrolase